MKVIVTYTEEANLQFAHRMLALPGDEETSQEFAIAYLRETKDRLIEFEGRPPESVRVGLPDPAHYRVPFINRIWIEYKIEDKRRWLWRKTRTITIVGFPVIRE
jgi:hypothetical protein